MPTRIAKAQSKPYPVFTKVVDCESYVTLNDIKKDAEKQMASMKPRLLNLVPEGQTQERLSAMRKGTLGHYVLNRVEQDRRSIDDDKLRELLESKGLYALACTTTPDHEKVAQLIRDGKFSATDLETCMKGKEIVFVTCDFEALK